jgi:hypothetical protein
MQINDLQRLLPCPEKPVQYGEIDGEEQHRVYDHVQKFVVFEPSGSVQAKVYDGVGSDAGRNCAHSVENKIHGVLFNPQD